MTWLPSKSLPIELRHVALLLHFKGLTMNKQKIAIKKLGALIIDTQAAKPEQKNQTTAMSLNSEMMNLGFVMSEKLFSAICILPVLEITVLARELIAQLRELKGAHVTHTPMYPNFPEQVMAASDIELYANAITHYWSNGEWKPEYHKLPKAFSFEETKYKEIDFSDEETFKQVFTQLLMSNDSLPEEDKSIIEWFMVNYAQSELTFPEDIPFQENKSVITAIMLLQNKDTSALISNSTDVLRMVTYLSEGDVSLASNTKFVSLPRSVRKELVKQLERVISEEDIGRHKNKWKALLHGLHVGDYSKKVYSIASKLRNNQALESFYGRLEHCLNTQDITAAITLLKTRPSEFARRLDHLLRLTSTKKKRSLARLLEKNEPNQLQDKIVSEFLEVSDQVSTRVLLQLLGHLGRRNANADKRVVFPKGNTQKAVVLRQTVSALDAAVVETLIEGIKATLVKHFSNQEGLGKVWIDPELMDCPLPTQQRSASEGLINVARGTRLPITNTQEQDTLRFFIYWVGKDIDLSATFHYEDFSLMESVSYTNLRSKGFQACHSGDITSAPNGASEFIDVTINGALKKGARYLTMNVLVYSGPTFSEHETCFAGWMMRSKPKSNEVFEPKTVTQKIDVRANSRNVIPVVFDLLTRKAIWTDISTSSSYFHGGNNVESNRASIQETLESVIDAKHKLSLYELFELHATARGETVSTREEADTVFSLDTGVTPFDVNLINSEYVV